MFLVSITLIVRFILILVLKLVAFLLSEKTPLIREEMSSYECGFEHHSLSRVPFSLRYFFLTLIFLLFDLEIVLIIFLPSLIFSVSYTFSLLILSFFIVVLYLRLVYE
jgi:NADH-ubiquinone oxidoreductase chain 3